jgi:hypothetical protein
VVLDVDDDIYSDGKDHTRTKLYDTRTCSLKNPCLLSTEFRSQTWIYHPVHAWPRLGAAVGCDLRGYEKPCETETKRGSGNYCGDQF